MTEILINILCLATGFTICSVLSWSFHRRHKQAWQKEYRRLMGGIKKAYLDLDKPNIPHRFIVIDLRRLFHNDPTWPRG